MQPQGEGQGGNLEWSIPVKLLRVNFLIDVMRDQDRN